MRYRCRVKGIQGLSESRQHVDVVCAVADDDEIHGRALTSRAKSTQLSIVPVKVLIFQVDISVIRTLTMCLKSCDVRLCALFGFREVCHQHMTRAAAGLASQNVRNADAEDT